MDPYEPIKHATESTISWLVETALQRGCKVKFLPDSIPQETKTAPKNTRLKGKARKQAKAAMETLKSSELPKPRVVSGAEILRLAKLLHDQQEVLVVSKRVRTDMRRAFHGRRFFAGKYKRERPDSSGNAPHAHFVHVLSEVVQILTPILFVRSADDELRAASIDTGVALSNAFEALTLSTDDDEIITDGTSSEEGHVQPSGPTDFSTPNLYKPDIDPEEEIFLQLYCLKHYVEEVSDCIVRLWRPYFTDRGSPFDLAMLTFVTEAALVGLTCLLRKLQQDLGPECPWDEICTLLPSWERTNATLSAARFIDYPGCIKLLPFRDADASQAWIEEDTFLVQYLAEVQVGAQLFQGQSEDSMDKESAPLFSGSHLDYITQAILYSSFGGSGLSNFFAVDLLHAVRRCAGNNLELPFHQLNNQTDDFERRLRYIHNLDIPDQVFAALSTDEQTSLFQLAEGHHFTICRYLAFRGASQNHPLRGRHHEMLQKVALPKGMKTKILKFATAKNMPNLKPSAEESQEFADTHVMPPEDSTFYRKSNPLSSGKLVLGMMVFRETADARCADLQPEVFAMCHLYNALRQLNVLTTPWPALEQIIELHMESLFLSIRPTTAKDALTRFMLSMGYSGSVAATLTRDNHNGFRASTVKKIMKKSQKLSAVLEPTPFVKALRDYCHSKIGIGEASQSIVAEMTKMYNTSCNKTNQVKTVGEFGAVNVFEMMFIHLQQQKPYFEIDLIESTRICNVLFRKMADVLSDLPDPSISGNWKDLSGIFITQQVLLQLCNSNAPLKIGPGVAILKAYISGGAFGMPS